MTLRCGSCQAALKFDEQRLAGRRSARCPRCQAIIDLTQETPAGAQSAAASPPAATVSCAGCGARLKVPAGTRAARSRCPRCGGTVDLAPEAPAPAARTEEESSSAATRRIDSRMLGMELAAGGAAMPPGLRAPAMPEPAPQPAAAGPDPTFTRPAVGKMREAVLDIEGAARDMQSRDIPVDRSAANPAARADDAGAAREAARRESSPHAGAASTEAGPSLPARPQDEARPPRPRAGGHIQNITPYPLSRGAIAGGLAGAILGLALWGADGAIAAAGYSWLMTPVNLSQVFSILPEPLVRLALLLIAGGLAGVMAAGAGSPGAAENPLRLGRCLACAALPALILALLAVLLPADPAEGFAVWPAVNWMRDILLAGLLTPLVNRFLPGA